MHIFLIDEVTWYICVVYDSKFKRLCWEYYSKICYASVIERLWIVCKIAGNMFFCINECPAGKSCFFRFRHGLNPFGDYDLLFSWAYSVILANPPLYAIWPIKIHILKFLKPNQCYSLQRTIIYTKKKAPAKKSLASPFGGYDGLQVLVDFSITWFVMVLLPLYSPPYPSL